MQSLLSEYWWVSILQALKDVFHLQSRMMAKKTGEIWTWVLWILVRCSYQLNHWSSSIGAKDRWHLSYKWGSDGTYKVAAAITGSSKITSVLIMQSLPKRDPPGESSSVYGWINAIYPLLQYQSSSGTVGKSIWPEFRGPRFESWLDLMIVAFFRHVTGMDCEQISNTHSSTYFGILTCVIFNAVNEEFS